MGDGAGGNISRGCAFDVQSGQFGTDVQEDLASVGRGAVQDPELIGGAVGEGEEEDERESHKEDGDGGKHADLVTVRNLSLVLE